tara:strand:+ start:1669 stop:3291 length:1623 start_codon:yes stop_codon:yes gene_type:complete
LNNNIKKVKIFISDLFKVIKLVKVSKKKIFILKISLANNLIVFFDILTILFFSKIFTTTEIDIPLLNNFFEYEIFLPVCIFLRFFFLYYERVTITKFQYKVEQTLREDLLLKIFENGSFSISDAYFYINELSRQVASFFSTFSIFFGSLIQLLLFSTYLIFTEFNAVLYFLVGFLILVIPTTYLTKQGRKYAHITYVQFQKISGDIEKILENMYLIKISKKVNSELGLFSENLRILYSSRIQDVKVGTLNNLLPNFSTLFLLSFLLTFTAIKEFLTLDFIAILLRMFQALGNLNKNIHMVSAYHVYLEKLYNVEELDQKINHKNYIIDKSANSVVEFKNVTFQYFNAESPTFEKLNLHIQKNKHTVLTGPNGSGKSTLIGLASGNLFPTKGNIISKTSKIGYVGSTPLIIKSSLKENILYGNSKNITEDDMLKILTNLELYSNPNELNLDQQISNKSLSTGQMQKISFARAVLGEKELLILDESTANLDTESKQKIYTLLSELELTILNSTHLDLDEMPHDIHLNIDTTGKSKTIVELSQ